LILFAIFKENFDLSTTPCFDLRIASANIKKRKYKSNFERVGKGENFKKESLNFLKGRYKLDIFARNISIKR